MSSCHFCQKPCESYHNYCSWECMVEEAKQAGGTVHTPNGLPIRSIDRDGNMWEHEHGDHPDYKFPVDVEYCGPEETAPHFVDGDGKLAGTDELNESLRHQTHALIYTDGHVALTLYECTYALWSLRDGQITAGHMWRKGEWRLTQESIAKVRP